MSRFSLALLVALLLPLAAFALATEQFGNTPIVLAHWGLPAGIEGVANLPSRVYWYEVNGSPGFSYRGNAAAANAAMKAFAALPTKDKEIRLVSGRGEGKDLQQQKTFPIDWKIFTPGRLQRAVQGESPTVMVLYVAVPTPAEQPDADAVRKLIADLDAPAFATREAAGKKLRDMEFAVATLLRTALQETASTETRTQIESLLDRLKGIYLPLLDLPADVRIVGPADRLEQCVKRMADADPKVRGDAALDLAASQCDRAKVVAALETLLKKEADEQALVSVVRAVGYLGADAKPLLPDLKKHLRSPDGHLKSALADVIKAVEEAKPVIHPADEVKQFAAIEADIQLALAKHRKR